MENFKESFAKHLFETLKIPAEKAEEVAHFVCDEHGVESFQDLSLLNEDDLAPVLKTVHRRKLLSWTSQRLNLERPEDLVVECVPTENISPDEVPRTTARSNDWLSSFCVPWAKMPSSLIKSLNEGKRPQPAHRREMVRIIVDEIRKYTSHPGMKAINYITKCVVNKYPCLMDTLCEDIIGEGNTYLSKQIRNRLENLNRGKGSVKLPKNLENQPDSQVAKKQANLHDRYGCCNWEPEIDEDGINALERKREELLLQYHRGPKNLEEKLVLTLIAETFPLQRKETNIPLFNIGVFQNRWPCIFLKVGLLKHFNELVGIDLEKRLEEEMTKKGSRIINFLKSVPKGSNKKEISDALLKIEDTLTTEEQADKKNELGMLITLLTAYFGEDLEIIFKDCSVAINQQNVLSIVDLPCTPCILVSGGSLFKSSNYMLLIDGVLVNDDIKSYQDAFMMFFASYFIFNIKYPEKLAGTLEFIQRSLLNLNPNRGNKHQKKNVKDGILPRVLSLINNLSSFEWL